MARSQRLMSYAHQQRKTLSNTRINIAYYIKHINIYKDTDDILRLIEDT